MPTQSRNSSDCHFDSSQSSGLQEKALHIVARSLPRKIISGGQTGVDRAALDWAISRAIPHGGWCPRGRIALDGRLADHYALQETKSPGYSERTRCNVRDADATLILSQGDPAGGSKLTQRIALRTGKPVFIVALESDWREQADLVREGLFSNEVLILNVAGPSENRVPGIYRQALEFLEMTYFSQTYASKAGG